MTSCRCSHRATARDFKPFEGDWKWSDALLHEAVGEALKLVEVDATHDVPYVAGYSQDGSRVYLDEHLARTFTDTTGKSINTALPLAMHELTEKMYEGLGLPYQLAHQIALRVERAVVDAHGVSWSEYNAFMDKWVAEIGAERVANPPKDLDLEPYVDEEDANELARICLRR